MEHKLTMLLYRTPDSVRSVQQGTFVAAYNALTGQLDEYRFPGQLPEPDRVTLYTIPAKTFEPAFAIHGAITCTKPDARKQAFMPSFCFSMQLRYISPIGLKKLLMEMRQKENALPDCIDLERLYNFLQPQLKAAAQRAAAKFSGGRALPYAYWWEDLTGGTQFRDALEYELRLLLNTYGFRLESGSLKIMGLASIPVD